MQLLGYWSVLYAWHLHINNKVPILISNRWEQTIICTNDLLKSIEVNDLYVIVITNILTLYSYFPTSDLSSKNNNHCSMVVYFVYTNERKTDTLLQFFLSNGINYFMLDVVNELWQRNSIQMYHSKETCFNIILNSIIWFPLPKKSKYWSFFLHILILFIYDIF